MGQQFRSKGQGADRKVYPVNKKRPFGVSREIALEEVNELREKGDRARLIKTNAKYDLYAPYQATLKQQVENNPDADTRVSVESDKEGIDAYVKVPADKVMSVEDKETLYKDVLDRSTRFGYMIDSKSNPHLLRYPQYFGETTPDGRTILFSKNHNNTMAWKITFEDAITDKRYFDLENVGSHGVAEILNPDAPLGDKWGEGQVDPVQFAKWRDKLTGDKNFYGGEAYAETVLGYKEVQKFVNEVNKTAGKNGDLPRSFMQDLPLMHILSVERFSKGRDTNIGGGQHQC